MASTPPENLSERGMHCEGVNENSKLSRSGLHEVSCIIAGHADDSGKEHMSQTDESYTDDARATTTMKRGACLESRKPPTIIMSDMAKSVSRSQASNLSSSTATTASLTSLDSIVTSSTQTSRNAPVTTNARQDRIVVMQSRPLVYFDAAGVSHALDTPDFEKEQKYLRKAVQEAQDRCLGNVEVVFEEASTQRLGAVLATGCPVLHFSCHGHSEYLCVEYKGALQPLLVEKLKSFVAAGKPPKLVFVAACHSGAAGQAFLDAGVPHVICCKTDESLRDSAAAEFAQTFYTSLACGNHLQEAFQLARQVVGNSPAVVDAEVEMNKFMLLPAKPEDPAYHDIPIFYNGSNARSALSTSGPEWKLPGPPDFFVGRETDMYKVIDALSFSRCVMIKGDRGIGKCSLVQAAVEYTSQHSHAFSFEKYYWVEPHGSNNDEVGRALDRAFAMVNDNHHEGLGELVVFKECIQRVAASLQGVPALAVFDTRTLNSDNTKKNLELLLRSVFAKTRSFKAVIICSPAVNKTPAFPYKIVSINLSPLDLRSAAMLFGHYCSQMHLDPLFPSLSTPRELADLLVPRHSLREPMSKTQNHIYSLLEKGHPGRIQETASSISETQFRKIVKAGLYQLSNETIPSLLMQYQRSEDKEHRNQLLRSIARLKELCMTLPTLSELERDIKKQDNSSSEIGPTLKQIDSPPSPTSIAFLGDFVGVELSGADMEGRPRWNEYIIRNKLKIETLLEKLGRYGSVEGEPKLSVTTIPGNQRAVIGLECEIELTEDLSVRQYGRIKEISRKLANHFKSAGATDKELESIMIGGAWKGSIFLILEAPPRLLSMLLVELSDKGPVRTGGMSIFHIAPAFLINRYPSSFSQRLSLDQVAKPVLVKCENLNVLVPDSSATLSTFAVGGACVDDNETRWSDSLMIATVVKTNRLSLTSEEIGVAKTARKMSSSQPPRSIQNDNGFSLHQDPLEIAQSGATGSLKGFDAENDLDITPNNASSIADIESDSFCTEIRAAAQTGVLRSRPLRLATPKFRRMVAMLLVVMVAVCVAVFVVLGQNRPGSGEPQDARESIGQTFAPSLPSPSMSPSRGPVFPSARF